MLDSHPNRGLPKQGSALSTSPGSRYLRLMALAGTLTFAMCCGRADSEPSAGSQQQASTASARLAAVSLAAGERLKAVATTSIVGDVVETIAGPHVDLVVLMPRGTDPHAFEPTPRDAVAVADADVVFAGGAGLEIFLEPLLQSVGARVPVVELSSGVDLLRFSAGRNAMEGELDTHDPHQEGEHDPHTWLDPNNVLVWVDNLERALSALDPVRMETYQRSAASYREQLGAVDAWIRGQTGDVPADRRKLVTDHASLGYFARRYGFEEVGAVLPGYSTLAEPSARELAELLRTVRQLGVPAVFVGMEVNPSVSQRISEDAGVRLVRLYTGSLSEPGGPADTYVRLVRYNVTAIVQALAP